MVTPRIPPRLVKGVTSHPLVCRVVPLTPLIRSVTVILEERVLSIEASLHHDGNGEVRPLLSVISVRFLLRSIKPTPRRRDIHVTWGENPLSNTPTDTFLRLEGR